MKHLPPAVAIIAAVVLLAGCTPPSPTASPPAPDATMTPAAARPTAIGSNAIGSNATGSAAAGSTTDESTGDEPVTAGGSARCAMITKADVSPLLTDPITTVLVSAAGYEGDGQDCTFGTDDGGSVEITVVLGSDQVANYAAQAAEFATPVAVPGVGDQAVRDSNQESGDLVSTGDGIVCSVTASDQNVPGVGALDLAAGGTNNIGDANYAIIAAALGTLCNRIYGRGTTSPDLRGLRQINRK